MAEKTYVVRDSVSGTFQAYYIDPDTKPVGTFPTTAASASGSHGKKYTSSDTSRATAEGR